MTFTTNRHRHNHPLSLHRHQDHDAYDASDSTDTESTHSNRPRPRLSISSHNSLSPVVHSSPRSFSPQARPSLPSAPSTANSTPSPSRPGSPYPPYFSSHPSSSCTSDTDSETDASYFRLSTRRDSWWREDRRPWWALSRRRRRSHWRLVRSLKRWSKRLIRHPFIPGQPITIVLTLILLSAFAIFLTLLLIHILNPDKEPLPWRAYCAAPELVSYTALTNANATLGSVYPPFSSSQLDELPPAGVLVGVFSTDSAFERRMLIRTTWASHQRSREGAGDGDRGMGTSRTVVRFILGQPRKNWERRIKLEMETYNDIIILPVAENMNGGKTYTYFSWAAIDAWVPPVYNLNNHTSTLQITRFSYSNDTASPPRLAPHDPVQAWQDFHNKHARSWVRPDYVVKVDEDSFVMLAELEARLRFELYNKPTPSDGAQKSVFSRVRASLSQGKPSEVQSQSSESDPLIYWGYFVTNRLHQFMAGELYALSWSLVDWVAREPTLKSHTKGAEDKQTAKWMRHHPRASDIRWTSERCWIYDHPRSGTVYSHGFLFPSEVTRIKRELRPQLEREYIDQPVFASPGSSSTPIPPSWAHSSVSTFRVRYAPPVPDLSPEHSVEALIEGSDMSMLREGRPMTSEYAWTHREGRHTRYEGARVGGTIVVHFIKKHMWFLETAMALLEGKEMSEFEKFRLREGERKEQEHEHRQPPVSGSAAAAQYTMRGVQRGFSQVRHRR